MDERAGGQTELDEAIYKVLQKLDDGKPLARNAKGHYTPAVRKRKQYLQDGIAAFMERHMR